MLCYNVTIMLYSIIQYTLVVFTNHIWHFMGGNFWLKKDTKRNNTEHILEFENKTNNFHAKFIAILWMKN